MTQTTTATQFTVRVTAGRYTDRGLATASWYDVHEVVAGDYPVTWTDVYGRPVADGDKPYYAVAEVPSIRIEEYRVNRFFSASSSETTTPNASDTLQVKAYAYEVKSGLKRLGGLAEFVEVAA